MRVSSNLSHAWSWVRPILSCLSTSRPTKPLTGLDPILASMPADSGTVTLISALDLSCLPLANRPLGTGGGLRERVPVDLITGTLTTFRTRRRRSTAKTHPLVRSFPAQMAPCYPKVLGHMAAVFRGWIMGGQIAGECRHHGPGAFWGSPPSGKITGARSPEPIEGRPSWRE